ncbi:MAG: PqqD family protein [Candidatus Aminicenantes bacterium]|nr:PqqD family protein [Candidatus Aminicenantes bacterium]
MKSKVNKQQELNLLELVPVKNLKWEKNEDGLICLLKPKFQLPFLKKHLLPLLKKPYYKINLDKIGSQFWESCDGVRTMEEIAACIKNALGDEVEPLYERITLFLQSLEKNKFIRFK